MSRKVIVNGESICYLPPTDASEIRFDMGGGNYSNVQTAIEGKVSKSGDTMTGNLTINREHEGTQNASSFLYLGNNKPEGTIGNSRGVLNLYTKGTNFVQLVAETASDQNRTIYFPDKSGTMALVEDLTADNVEYSSGVSVKQKIDSMTPTRTQFTPNYGASSDFASRNFFVTDNATFLDVHFCLYCGTAINANVDLITLPTIARNKIPQYGVGVETSNNKAHLVYNNGNYIYLDGTNITANSNGVFSGTFRMSLV